MRIKRKAFYVQIHLPSKITYIGFLACLILLFHWIRQCLVNREEKTYQSCCLMQRLGGLLIWLYSVSKENTVALFHILTLEKNVMAIGNNDLYGHIFIRFKLKLSKALLYQFESNWVYWVPWKQWKKEYLIMVWKRGILVTSQHPFLILDLWLLYVILNNVLLFLLKKSSSEEGQKRQCFEKCRLLIFFYYFTSTENKLQWNLFCFSFYATEPGFELDF